ncbi:MAG: ABC transporter permease subunit [Lentisphaerae bacterium]|nr:ABC transporter permease subunit [Lentisphaerota bacterium]
MFHEDGSMEVVRTTRRKNIMTGQTTVRRTVFPVPYKARPAAGAPAFLALSGLGDAVSLAWADGRLQRYDVRSVSDIRLVEETDLLGDPSLRLTALRFLLGRFTLLAGDSGGRVRAWFVVHSDPGAAESTRLAVAHEFAGPAAPVTALASSARIRMFAAGYGDGSVRLYHVTSGKRLADLRATDAARPVEAVAFSPKDDAVSAATSPGYTAWDLDPRHPEATLPALFTRVWYEGAAGPEHVWQSSSGTDDFEPKLGLMPLVFGTIKATFFSLLFGVPIALMGAIFTSEFLNPRWKARIKPTVELMASLPSVVLGFLAALVFAPVVADALPAVLASFVTVPATFLAGAYLWQLLPYRWTLRNGGLRLPLMLAIVPAGLWMARGLGAGLERWCFSGDIVRWLDGQIGRAAGGWVVVLFPLVAVLVGWIGALTLNPILRTAGRTLSRPVCAALDALKFAALLAVAVAGSVALAFILDFAGLDPRGAVLGTYVQRNALVVGFVMGFAIIPIIYTIAEDALSAVPEHLRSASLGCGATAWQTATRIIVPTAASGLFSAVMIGLGRAVGETMIVLMAAGNTPVMEWNIFNGFRTLSANIAVELPEAVRNSTHYRTLFLAALVLFAMTFVLNTIAETIRLRFRRRAVEL